ncbi:MAG: hypothetical protein HFH16_01570 [Ruminococcus sp.]|uniref:Uncharacterized protein n=2 Tax=Schaedlerella arabinosiphila TaxID=2044587 RepID=A0A426DHM6_9FIRM|nr:hypothetical protein [Ruminococcus sp.]RRK32221.1 hypothetical protein EBB54_13260 [Schaedlerella arabinosiphila]
MLMRYKNIWDNKNWMILFAVVLTILRVFFALKTPLYGLGTMMHDDYLLVNYADSLQNSEWLGLEYNNLTLAKGISFSFFLYICNLLLIPYPLGLILFWILSLLILIAAVKNVVGNREALLLMYLFLLYSPATFASSYSQQIYRMAVVPAAVVFVAACLIGLFFRRDEKISIQVRWALGAGVGLSFFWYIREDSIWLLPFVLGALLCTAIGGIAFQNERGVLAAKKLIVYTLPILTLLLTNHILSLKNESHYGIYTVSDRTDTNFSKVVSNMLKVEREGTVRADDRVWITKKQMEKMIDACPTLKSIEPQLKQIYESAWCIDGEIEGDIIFWALRDAVAWSGQYQSAADTDQFYKTLNEELTAALNQGTLKRREAIYLSSMGKGLTKEDIPFLLRRMAENMKSVFTYELCKSEAQPGNGNWEQLRKMEAVTGAMLVYPNRVSLKIGGMIQPAKNAEKLEVYIKAGSRMTELSIENGFSVEIEDVDRIEAAQFQIYENGDLKDTMELKTGKNAYCKIEVYNIEKVVSEDPLIKKSEPVIKISNIFIKIYQKTSILFLGFSFLGYLGIFVKMLTDLRKKRYECVPVFLIMTGFGISILVCMLGVSWFTAWMQQFQYRWYTFFYTAGVIAVLQMFQIFGICFGIKNVLKSVLSDRRKSWIK